MSVTSNYIDAYTAVRKKSAAIYRRASAVLGGNVGHDLRYFEPMPLYIERGLAGRKWDVDGNEYIDFLMGNGALLLGHADPEVIDAIASTASRGTHFGNDHPLQIEWAELIQKLVPSAERVRFVNSGTEASQLALRLARAFTGKSKLLRFEGHFHGWHDEVVHGFQLPFDADGSRGVPPSVRDNIITLPDGSARGDPTDSTSMPVSPSTRVSSLSAGPTTTWAQCGRWTITQSKLADASGSAVASATIPGTCRMSACSMSSVLGSVTSTETSSRSASSAAN
jgi:hypothetical protein